MNHYQDIAQDSHQRIVHIRNDVSGLSAFVGIHNTNLGPALGGCRMFPYASEEEAIYDVTRLSEGMTYKNALANIPFGGGKSVIIGDPATDKSEDLLRDFAKGLNDLSGEYLSAEDSGIGPQDIAIMARTSKWVAGGDTNEGGGDPSPYTAYGVFLGIKAALKYKYGTDKLDGIKVAVEGLGHVGYDLARRLRAEGAYIIGADIRPEICDKAQQAFNAKIVLPDACHHQDVDIYAPCALGGALSAKRLDNISAPIIAGAANNQLATAEIGDALHQKKILYCPDYVINAAGVISIGFEFLKSWEEARISKAVEQIPHTLAAIFDMAHQQDRPTYQIAEEMAQKKIMATENAA